MKVNSPPSNGDVKLAKVFPKSFPDAVTSLPEGPAYLELAPELLL